jgi:hypothetical protein
MFQEAAVIDDDPEADRWWLRVDRWKRAGWVATFTTSNRDDHIAQAGDTA